VLSLHLSLIRKCETQYIPACTRQRPPLPALGQSSKGDFQDHLVGGNRLTHLDANSIPSVPLDRLEFPDSPISCIVSWVIFCEGLQLSKAVCSNFTAGLLLLVQCNVLDGGRVHMR
jgi:hypothetical protein